MVMGRGEMDYQRQRMEMLERSMTRARHSMDKATANRAACALVQGTVDLAILLGGSRDVPIAWPAPFHGPDYRVDLVPISGMVGRGTLSVVDGSQTAAGVTVRVTAGLAIAVGAQFLAHASC